MLQKFQEHIVADFPFLKNEKILLAISGGIDSVVLAHLCKAENLNFAFAHCNYNLRGKESDADEVFVRSLAEDLNVTIHVESFEIPKNKTKSIQLDARNLRYAWFEKLCQENSYFFILTAHHLNDSIETFFINTLRGTGLEGLTGIPQINGRVVRPLLNFSRKEILVYAEEQKIKWREDRSNTSDDYLRNRVRHKIMPVLEKENPNFTDSFLLTQNHLQDASNLVDDYISNLWESLMQKKGGAFHLNIPKLKSIPNTKAVLFGLFKDFGFTAWNDIQELLDAQPGKYVFSKHYRLLKDREELILSKRKTKISCTIIINKNDGSIDFPNGKIVLEKVTKVTQKNNQIAYISAEKLIFPLQLRLWKSGDVFKPFGMNGHKKLSDFLKDEKLSLLEKENTWVLTSNGKIIWVVGHRLDDNYKVENNTKNIFKIELIR